MRRGEEVGEGIYTVLTVHAYILDTPIFDLVLIYRMKFLEIFPVRLESP